MVLGNRRRPNPLVDGIWCSLLCPQLCTCLPLTHRHLPEHFRHLINRHCGQALFKLR